MSAQYPVLPPEELVSSHRAAAGKLQAVADAHLLAADAHQEGDHTQAAAYADLTQTAMVEAQVASAQAVNTTNSLRQWPLSQPM